MGFIEDYIECICLSARGADGYEKGSVWRICKGTKRRRDQDSERTTYNHSHQHNPPLSHPQRTTSKSLEPSPGLGHPGNGDKN